MRGAHLVYASKFHIYPKLGLFYETWVNLAKLKKCVKRAFDGKYIFFGNMGVAFCRADAFMAQ